MVRCAGDVRIHCHAKQTTEASAELTLWIFGYVRGQSRIAKIS